MSPYMRFAGFWLGLAGSVAAPPGSLRIFGPPPSGGAARFVGPAPAGGTARFIGPAGGPGSTRMVK